MIKKNSNRGRTSKFPKTTILITGTITQLDLSLEGLRYHVESTVVTVALDRNYYPDLNQEVIRSYVDWYPVSSPDRNLTAINEIRTTAFHSDSLAF